MQTTKLLFCPQRRSVRFFFQWEKSICQKRTKTKSSRNSVPTCIYMAKSQSQCPQNKCSVYSLVLFLYQVFISRSWVEFLSEFLINPKAGSGFLNLTLLTFGWWERVLGLHSFDVGCDNQIVSRHCQMSVGDEGGSKFTPGWELVA